MARSVNIVRWLRWLAMFSQNLSAAAQATAMQIEAELDQRARKDPDQFPIQTPEDVKRAAARVPPGEYDDHPPTDLGADDFIRNDD